MPMKIFLRTKILAPCVDTLGIKDRYSFYGGVITCNFTNCTVPDAHLGNQCPGAH